jgi:hypothetical protein
MLSMGNIVDGIIIELLEDIKGRDHLDIVESFSCPLAKQKNGWNMSIVSQCKLISRMPCS